MAVTLSDLAKTGDKIDLTLSQGASRMLADSKEENKCYKSAISDFLSSEEVEISMPTENGKVVLFPIGIRCNMLVYTKRGLYTCAGIVTKRYKKDNLLLLSVMLRSAPQKFQRREFFRISCMLDVKFYRVPEEIAELKTTAQLKDAVAAEEYETQVKEGMALDISGGGMRFTSGELLEPGEYLLAVFRLRDEKLDNMFYLITEVVGSEPVPNNREKFSSRGKFLFKDLRDRESIVSYVFEAERRMRKKEIG